MPELPSAPPPPPGPSAALRSPVGPCRAVVALLAVVALTDLFAVGTGWFSLDVLDRLADDPDSVTNTEIELADNWYAKSGILQLLALLPTAVVFLVWFHRVRVNAEVFAPDQHSKSRGWVIGGWFCPVVNLWFPRRIALDIWLAGSDGDRRGTYVLNWWWAMFLLSWAVGRAGGRQYADAVTTDEIRTALTTVLISDGADLVAALLAILLALRITATQHEKAQHGAPTSTPPPFVPHLPAA